MIAAAIVVASIGAVASAADLGVTEETLVYAAAFPTYLTQAPGDPTRLYYSERAGRIRVVHDGTLLPTPFLDIDALVGDTLQSFEFHPDFQTNGFFYVVYLTPEMVSVVARYTALGPDTADPASEEILLTLEQPLSSHNVNWVGFGPDGYLYIAVGDGGAATSGEHAQDLSLLFGKILRVDVDSGLPYTIPPDNPFVASEGLDEIWAYGLRNPWRLSFDRFTGDLWISDVGDSSREEFSMQPAGSPGGENYGWNCMEGFICHTPADGCVCGEPGLIAPLYDYTHGVGCAIIGGYVYRGDAIQSLQGHYVFADNCSGRVWAYDCTTGDVTDLFSIPMQLTSFGEDLDGELYVLNNTSVRKLVFTDCNENGIPDIDDIAGGSDDCNANSVPDECEPDCNGNGAADECDIADGTSFDDNGNGVPDECDAAADINNDGIVSTADLLILLGSWGKCPGCPADLNNDGVVGTADLLILLGNWGDMP
jgi:glucose/arabinose dehydrogenase